MNKNNPPTTYRSYLLRFWTEESRMPGKRIFRFSLESPHTRQTQGFSDLEKLVEYLRTEMTQLDAGRQERN